MKTIVVDAEYAYEACVDNCFADIMLACESSAQVCAYYSVKND